MSNQVISLTGCNKCPLRDNATISGEVIFICCHPKREDPTWEYSLTALFENCPLKQHSLTIQIEQNGTE